jgi:aminoglycoside phosphotransferase (APT) family kinase protein
MAQVTSKSTAAPFSATTAESVLVTACEAAEMDAGDARLLRLGENALFYLPAEPAVVRIARTMDYWRDVMKEVAVARWLEGCQFPAAEVCGVSQPIQVADHPVTFWRFIDGRSGGRSDIACLGALLRRLHKLPRPTTFDLPGEDILGRVRKRIDGASVSSADKDFLLSRLGKLATEVPRLRYPLAPAPTHGDAHVQNLMFRDGQAVLIDFERFAWGQPEWDLSMTATEYQTAGWWTESEYGQFVEAYGYDVTSWTDGFPVLRAVHEIKMTTWLMQNVNESSEIAKEYEKRMHTIRGEGTDSKNWRPF